MAGVQTAGVYAAGGVVASPYMLTRSIVERGVTAVGEGYLQGGSVGKMFGATASDSKVIGTTMVHQQQAMPSPALSPRQFVNIPRGGVALALSPRRAHTVQRQTSMNLTHVASAPEPQPRVATGACSPMAPTVSPLSTPRLVSRASRPSIISTSTTPVQTYRELRLDTPSTQTSNTLSLSRSTSGLLGTSTPVNPACLLRSSSSLSVSTAESGVLRYASCMLTPSTSLDFTSALDVSATSTLSGREFQGVSTPRMPSPEQDSVPRPTLLTSKRQHTRGAVRDARKVATKSPKAGKGSPISERARTALSSKTVTPNSTPAATCRNDSLETQQDLALVATPPLAAGGSEYSSICSDDSAASHAGSSGSGSLARLSRGGTWSMSAAQKKYQADREILERDVLAVIAEHGAGGGEIVTLSEEQDLQLQAWVQESDNLKMERERLQKSQAKHQQWLKSALSQQVDCYEKELTDRVALFDKDSKRLDATKAERLALERKQSREAKQYVAAQKARLLEKERSRLHGVRKQIQEDSRLAMKGMGAAIRQQRINSEWKISQLRTKVDESISSASFSPQMSFRDC
eukprot:TRINITY_DN16188_c0_g1_i2.p1 TRINITY_DN16188_c0_g1~~TRINITY_DN16188_c0_g1_i2.p1  ORF type:complete len:575 (+),score=114.38 TRINITY_DN16188_c0_g1_i2:88-1812(+)